MAASKDFQVRIWRSGHAEPEAAYFLAGQLRLSREELGSDDRRLSRGPAAPVLRQKDATLELWLNPKAARLPLVVTGLGFMDLQDGGLLQTGIWPLRPAQLSEQLRRAACSDFCLGLFTQQGLPGASHLARLLTLPALPTLAAGQSLQLTPPCTIVLADAAIEIVPASTLACDAEPPRVPSEVLELQALHDAQAAFVVLHKHEVNRQFAIQQAAQHYDVFALPGSDAPVALSQCEAQLANLMSDEVIAPYCLVPVLARSKRSTRSKVSSLLPWHRSKAPVGDEAQSSWVPLIAIVYRSATGVRVLLSDTQLQLFLHRTATALQANGSGSPKDTDAIAPSAAKKLTSDATQPPQVANEPSEGDAVLEAPVLEAPVLAAFGSLETRSPALREVFRELCSVADSKMSILLLGESGTGKEHVAREVHAQSGRAGAPFVAINCGAIPEGMIERELYGHIRGAFTGADRSAPGAFQAADGGTLLLDEIGDAPPAVQTSLLRVLESGNIRPVGAPQEIAVDVRVIAATRHDIDQAIAEGRFREDLYFRLAGTSVILPPLRERVADMPALIEHLLTGLSPVAGEMPLSLNTAGLNALLSYAWPGNVRQLRSALQRGAALCQATGDSVLGVEHFALGKLRPGAAASRQSVAEHDGTPWPFLQEHVILAKQALAVGTLKHPHLLPRRKSRAKSRAVALFLLTYERELLSVSLSREMRRLFLDGWMQADLGFVHLTRELRAEGQDAEARLLAMLALTEGI